MHRGRCLGLQETSEGVLATVVFSAHGAPSLAMGARLPLVFRADRLSRSVSVEARTVLCTEVGLHRCYSFRLEGVARRSLLRLSRRRAAARVRPGPAWPVAVKVLEIEGRAPRVLLHDLSTRGLAVLVDQALDEELCARRQLGVSIRLLDDQEPFVALTKVCHRRLADTGAIYGLEIDAETPRFELVQELLSRTIAELRTARGRWIRRAPDQDRSAA